MTPRVAERRRSFRTSAAYPAVISDRHCQILTRGRTVNISESGVFVVAQGHAALRNDEEVLVCLTVPALAGAPVRRPHTRNVTYLCRIVRIEKLGQLLGLGIHFLQKLR